MVQAVINPIGNPFKRVEAVRPETTGAMAARPEQRTNIFASAGVTVPSSIFGSSGSSETSGSCASSGSGGNTIAVA